MKIAVLTQYFPPTSNACTNRMTSLCLELQKLGHEITVVAGMPNYPDGIKPAPYRWKLYRREQWSGMTVHRTYEFPTANQGNVGRALNYLSFMLSACLAVFVLPRQDVLIVTSPPLFVTVPARLLARLRARTLVVDVRDAWPRVLIEAGHARPDSGPIRWLERMELAAYDAADLVTVATEGLRDHVSESCAGRPGAPPEILVSRNGISTDLEPAASPVAIEPGDFTITFAGNFTRLYDLVGLLKFAAELQTEPDATLATVRFLFVGDGELLAPMRAALERDQIHNVRFADWLPQDQVMSVLRDSDACVLYLHDLDLMKGALPAKMFEAMYSDCAILTNMEGEARRMLEGADCGYFFDSGNYGSFRDAVQAMVLESEVFERRRRNAREYVLAHHDRAAIVRELEGKLRPGGPQATASS
jgi:glycosyltransferase involved in cell wall biosynthesis